MAVSDFATEQEQAVTSLRRKGNCFQKKARTINNFWGLLGKPCTLEHGSQQHCKPYLTLQCHWLPCFPKQHTCTFRPTQIPGYPNHWLGDATHSHREPQGAVRSPCCIFFLQCFHPIESWTAKIRHKTSQSNAFKALTYHSLKLPNHSQGAFTADAPGPQPSWHEVFMNLETFYDLNDV